MRLSTPPMLLFANSLRVYHCYDVITFEMLRDIQSKLMFKQRFKCKLDWDNVKYAENND